jgi:hypothetical protein
VGQPKQLTDGYHFSLSLGRSLFSDILSTALPISVKKGEFELAEGIRQIMGHLQVREKVAGLLEDRGEQSRLVRVKDRAMSLWDDRREQVLSFFEEIVRVEGEWELELDQDGTEFHYGDQTIGAEATFKLSAKGKARFLSENLELPFELSKRFGAEVHLRDIEYDPETGRIVGYLRGLSLKLGDHPFWRLVEDASGKLINQQADRFNPVPILQSEQIEGLLEPAASALKMNMEIDDLALDVGPEYMTLKVRFAFSQKQLTVDIDA